MSKVEGVTLLGNQGTKYPQKPEDAILETFPNRSPGKEYWVKFDCPEFTSLCRVTSQPDFGRITIEYIPEETCVESKALKLYLFSYRNVNEFHEEVVNHIFEDIKKACNPRALSVKGDFNPRGGISIAAHRSEVFHGRS